MSTRTANLTAMGWVWTSQNVSQTDHNGPFETKSNMSNCIATAQTFQAQTDHPSLGLDSLRPNIPAQIRKHQILQPSAN